MKETLAEEIAYSRRMLEWQDNWDDDGAQAIDRATYDRAIALLEDANTRLTQHEHVTMPVPVISTDGEGGIDLHWKTERHELLLNLSSDGSTPTYYGDTRDRPDNKIQGELVTSDITNLMLWLLDAPYVLMAPQGSH